MEENKAQLQSVWGNWWIPFRQWFYPAWLLYETSIRFQEYALSVYHFLQQLQNNIGDETAAMLSISGGVGTFVICFAFLTIPGCIALFTFFEPENCCQTSFEKRIKKYI